MISITSYAGLAAISATVIAAWQNIKNGFSYVSSFLVLRTTVMTGASLESAVFTHIVKHYKTPPLGKLMYLGVNLKLDGRMGKIIPFRFSRYASFYRGKTGTYYVTTDACEIHLTSLRFLSNPEQLIKDAVTEFNEEDVTKKSNRFAVHRVVGSVGSISFHEDRPSARRGDNNVLHNDDGHEDNSRGFLDRNVLNESFMYSSDRFRSNETNNPFAGLFYPEEVTKLLAQLELWYHRRAWYQEHSIPWRTGALLWGPGGTGKSSFAKATAEKLGIPLYQYSLNTLNDKEFQNEWDDMRAPCVVALEDFDTAFHGREPTTPHKSLSFECVLNQISGISAKEGVLLIVTTNHLEHIDPALGRLDENGRPTRPGRIDHIVHMEFTTQGQREAIAQHVLAGLDPDLITQALARGASTTAAQFQGLCIDLALANMGREEHGN